MKYQVLKQAEDNNGHIDVIQEVIIFRCKNGISDFILGDQNSIFPGYDSNGFPTEDALNTGNIEVIDISDIVISYSFSHENQFSSSICNLEIANIDGLYSPENITFLDGTHNRVKMKSKPVIPPAHNDDFPGFTLTPGKDYYEYNPNYFKNTESLFNPIFKSNHVIKIREGLVENGEIVWANKFLGLVSVVSPASDGGQPKLSVTCNDFMKLLQQSSCERSYISPIVDIDGNYYYNQKEFSNQYLKAPSNRRENFKNGFNKNYERPTGVIKLTSHGDSRSWSNLNANGFSLTPYWSQQPTPRVWIGHNDGLTKKGYMVRYYNGTEPTGTPVAVEYLDKIEFGNGSAGWKPDGVSRSDNWCCIIEAEVRYDANNKSILYSVSGEGSMTVFWDETQLESRSGGRVRGGQWFFEVNDKGLPVPVRRSSTGADEPNGLIYWTDISSVGKKAKLKVVYRCGESHGTTIDLTNRPGWRNILRITSANSDAYDDLNDNFIGITGRLVELHGNSTASEFYTDLTGKWKPILDASVLPKFVDGIGPGTTNPGFGYWFGPLLMDTSLVPKIYSGWEITSDNADWPYTVIYTRGTVEFSRPTSLGSDFSLYANFAHKEISSISVKEVLEDLIVEDVFGVNRYEYDVDPSSYNYPTNSLKFALFLSLLDIAEPNSFVESIRLDNETTKNCFDAVQKVLQGIRSNFKIKADATGRFIGKPVLQSGGPIVFGLEETEYQNANGDSRMVRATVKPKASEVTDRFFISMSAIGRNGDQDSSSTARRETLINGEVSMDMPGITVKDDPSYSSTPFSQRWLGIMPFKNLVFQDGRFEHKDSSLSNTHFIERFAVYARSWNTSLAKWEWERFEFSTTGGFLKAVTDSEPAGVDLFTYNELTHGKINYYTVNLGDILVNNQLPASWPSLGLGEVQYNYEPNGTDLRPKIDIRETEIGLTPDRNSMNVVVGSPLIVDYDYRTTIVTNINSPTDDSELLTKVKVVGKKRATLGSDLLEDLKRQVSVPGSGITAEDVIPVVNLPYLSSSDVLTGITPNGLISNLSKIGVTQGFFSSSINNYDFKALTGPFKLIPPSEPKGIDDILQFPGLVIGYGRSEEYWDSSLNQFRLKANWNKVTEYYVSKNQYFDFSSTNQHSEVNEISGEEAARAFYFRIKVPNPGYTYELNFIVASGSDGEFSVNGSQLYKLVPPGFNPFDFEMNQFFRAQTTKENPFIDVAFYYYHKEGDGGCRIEYKESKIWSNDSGYWDKIKAASLPMQWCYAGVSDNTGYLQLNGIAGAAVAFQGGNAGGTVHNIVTYTYGHLHVFITDQGQALVRYGKQRAVGGSDFTNNGENEQKFTTYIAPLNYSYEVYTDDDTNTYDHTVIGTWYDTPNGGQSWQKSNGWFYLTPGTPFVDGMQFRPDGISKYLTPQLSAYSALETDAGMDAFEIDLQDEKEIGEIGILVGFSPSELEISELDTSEVSLEQHFVNQTIDLMRPVTRTDLSTNGFAVDSADTVISSGYIYNENFPTGNDNVLFNSNVSGVGDCFSHDGSTVVFKKQFAKAKPKSIQANSIVQFEIKIWAKSQDETEWRALVDWQKVHTRAEYYKFSFDSLVTTNYRKLKVSIRKPESVIYESKIDEKTTNKLVYSKRGGVVAGPEIKMNFTGTAGATKFRQLFIAEPARAELKFFSVIQIYVNEKDNIYSIAKAEKDIKHKWYNPMLPYNGNKILRTVDGVQETVNHLMGTFSDNSAGRASECLNGALQILNDSIRPKESITLNVAYHPGLQINQTVWVGMGAISGFVDRDDSTTLFANHPGKMMLIDRIGHSKNGIVPQVQLTLRNYR